MKAISPRSKKEINKKNTPTLHNYYKDKKYHTSLEALFMLLAGVARTLKM